jgi:hypothetical protein
MFDLLVSRKLYCSAAQEFSIARLLAFALLLGHVCPANPERREFWHGLATCLGPGPPMDDFASWMGLDAA